MTTSGCGCWTSRPRCRHAATPAPTGWCWRWWTATAAGRPAGYTLDGGPTHAECRATPAATADLRLSQRALAGIYLGGVTVAAQQLAGLVDEETPGAAARLESMFWTAQQPWNATPF